jgi:hypothetical protein
MIIVTLVFCVRYVCIIASQAKCIHECNCITLDDGLSTETFSGSDKKNVALDGT